MAKRRQTREGNNLESKVRLVLGQRMNTTPVSVKGPKWDPAIISIGLERPLVPAPKSKISRKAFTDTIKIVVGTDNEEFTVAKELICEHSEFFNSACSDRWGLRTFSLEEEDPVVFGIFLVWITTGDLTRAEDLIEIPESTTTDKEAISTTFKNRFEQLAQCFILGDFLQASKEFQNDITDAMIALAQDADTQCGNHEWLTTPFICIWRNATSKSRLRKLTFELVVSLVNATSFVRTLHEDPEVEIDFLVCMEIRRHSRRVRPAWEIVRYQPCYYHEHVERGRGTPCPTIIALEKYKQGGASRLNRVSDT